MAPAPHFIQVGEAPAVICEGVQDLVCGCGRSVLVRGYIPANLLAIDIRCARCGTVTTTPGLPDGAPPPSAVIVAERREQPLPRPASVARLSALISREEADRLTRLYSPCAPDSDLCVIDAASLDAVAAEADRLTDGRLSADLAAVEAAAGTGPTAGYPRYALAWAIRHLRKAHLDPAWSWFASDAGSVATTLVAAFRHFTACWSKHPLFPTMVATAADHGFSLHAMAFFGTAKCLAESGNRVAFPTPTEANARFGDCFHLAVGPSDRWDIVVEAFTRFEWPQNRSWEGGALRAAVEESLSVSQRRLNLRHPGLLVLSAGAAHSAFDQPFGDEILRAVQREGRRHRGLAAVCAILPKLVDTGQPNAPRFGYAFYPFQNRHFVGEVVLGTAPT